MSRIMIKKAVTIIVFVLIVSSIAGCITNNTNQTPKTSVWSANWTSLGSNVAPNPSPAVSSGASGQLDAFVIGSDNALYHKNYTNGVWSANWTSLGGNIALNTSPAVSSGASGQLDAFVVGLENALYQKSYA